MSQAFLIQSAVSMIAVLMLVALAGWARIARPTPPLDAETAARRLAEEFPGQRPQGVWISADGRSVLARARDKALILFQVGDDYVARSLDWSVVAATEASDGRLILKFNEIGAPRARFHLPPDLAWPPSSSAEIAA